jgi:hypothetical protein
MTINISQADAIHGNTYDIITRLFRPDLWSPAQLTQGMWFKMVKFNIGSAGKYKAKDLL